jgi:hypothetical protein
VIAMTVAEFFFDTRLGLMLTGAFGLVVLLIVANYASRPLEKIVSGRRLRRRGMDAYHATHVPLPPELEPGDASFEALGFEQLATIRNADNSTFAIRLRPRDGVVAETVLYVYPKLKDTIVLELTSSLAGRQGTLATSTSGLGSFFWPGELRQVFPGASAEHLLEYHEEALVSLAEGGILPDHLTADEILPLRADMLNRSLTAVARAPVGAVRAATFRALRGQHAHVGKLMDQEEVGARLDAFWLQAGDRGR